MPCRAKCQRVKRPTTVATRSALAKKSFYNKRSYKSLYEKLERKNNALVKALSKVKQENQYLSSKHLALISRIQELKVARNRHNDVTFAVLENIEHCLELSATAAKQITSSIALYHQFYNTPQ